MRLLRSFVFTGIARFLSSRGGSSAVSGPAPERHYLTSRGCGGWNAARQPAGLDAAKVAADLLRGLGQRVSGVIACKGDQGGRAPPIGIPTPLPSRAGARQGCSGFCLQDLLVPAAAGGHAS